MFANSVTLFELFGLKVRVNISWAFIAILLAWSLSQGYFPSVYEGLPRLTYWWMGVVGVLGLFISILIHEIAHSLVARHYGMTVKSITLWLLGGVAELADEPPSPRVEFEMAIAGPIASLVLAILFYAASLGLAGLESYGQLAAVAFYLALANGVIAVFNLIPAFPMDGGRVLRAWLWHVKGDARHATRSAATVGSWFGFGLIGLGLLSVAAGFGLNGLWWVLLGLFVHVAAQSARYQSEVQYALNKSSVLDFMTHNPVAVPIDINARQFVDQWVLKHHHKFFPVLDGSRIAGCISTRHLSSIEPNRFELHTVADMMDPVSEMNSIAASATATDALSRMQETGNSRLLVLEGDELVGLVSLKDLLRVVALRSEFFRTEPS